MNAQPQPQPQPFAPSPDLQRAMHAGGAAAWAWDPGTMTVRLDELAMRWWGTTSPEIGVADLIVRIHAEDREEAKALWDAAAREGLPFVHTFRTDPDRVADAPRWIAARGAPPGPSEAFTAIFLDVTEMRGAQEAQELMLREMGHRIGNLFAVASSMTSIAARGASDPRSLAADLRQRFSQLSGAFRTISRDAAAAETPAVVRNLMSPYEGFDRIDLDLEGPVLAQEHVTTLSLVLHELTTNALKYGSLAHDGRVTVRTRHADGVLRLDWAETGGPVLTAPPGEGGLGRRLVEAAVADRPGGAVRWSVEDGALRISIELRVAGEG